MWNNGMMPNLYGTYGAPMPYGQNANIDDIYNQYKQMQQQMQQPMQSNANPAMGQRGTFIEIKSYSEVENYPVPTNGIPVLFFDFANYVFYSKKFVNGQCSIQDFYFGPMNGKNTHAKEVSEPIPETEPAQDPVVTALFEKMEMLEKRFDEIRTKSSKAQSKKVAPEVK